MGTQANTTDQLLSEGSVGAALRLPGGRVDLSSIDTRSTPGFSGKKADGRTALRRTGAELSDLQERLFAHGRSGGQRRVLMVLQGMDTSGKGGTMRHSIALLDPQGVHIASFQAPTEEEHRRGFLWRIEQQLPAPGIIGIFDRSHYEDVLIARVRELAPRSTIEQRYDAINEFEAELVDSGVTLVKCFLHISADAQRERLLARLEDPAKHWKFSPEDVDDRELWDDYRRAYEIALERCHTARAPWYVVPADRKWYRNWAVTMLLLEHLRALDLQWPTATFDVAKQRARLSA